MKIFIIFAILLIAWLLNAAQWQFHGAQDVVTHDLWPALFRTIPKGIGVGGVILCRDSKQTTKWHEKAGKETLPNSADSTFSLSLSMQSGILYMFNLFLGH